MWDGNVKQIKTVLRSYLVLLINVKPTDANSPYTECGMTKIIAGILNSKVFI